MLILSVRHTGTRFTRKFLEQIEVRFEQIHAIKEMAERIAPLISGGMIIPMRDPLLSWISHYIENKQRGMDGVTSRFIESWDCLKEYADQGPHIYLRLDTEDKAAELEKVAEFCDVYEDINFKWEGVGVTKDAPSDYDLWAEIRRELPDNGEILLDKLAPYRDRYGYGAA